MPYNVEYAKTGRSSCKKCKEKIGQGEIRLGAESDAGDYTMTSWYHPRCFAVPRKLGKIGADEFVANHLEDKSEEGNILPDKADELAQILGTSSKAKATPKKKEGGGDSFLDQLKADYEALNPSTDKKKKRPKDEEDEEPDTKRPKSENPAVELYGKYHKKNVDELKDYLRWNRQVLKGTKGAVLLKLIDGELRGRLPRCSVCGGGKLKLNDDCTKVVCQGVFDEELRVAMACDVTYSLENAPRAQPWYTEKPSEEQEKEMDRLADISKGNEPEDAPVEKGSDLEKLLKAAEGIKLDLSGKEAIQQSTKKMVKLIEESDAKLDVPDEEKKIRMAVGKILLANREASPAELVKLIVKHFGFANAKAKKAAIKEQAVAEQCACPENAPLLMAFKELAELYFKEKNANAGGSYMKVATALKNVKRVVTADNCMAMSKKGKDKVDGIGASSAQKIKEFLTTGTIQKLEEKRANLA